MTDIAPFFGSTPKRKMQLVCQNMTCAESQSQEPGLAFLNSVNEFAQFPNLVRSDLPTRLNTLDSINAHSAQAAKGTFCDPVRKAPTFDKAPIFEMKVVIENATLVVHVTNHRAHAESSIQRFPGLGQSIYEPQFPRDFALHEV
jgi:hypothetical protein